ncbi:flagellar basal body-associated FliL family protein [Halarsenatibacter silvermanii]|uniref:Flagellar protein FliL n=1 Tax=Halarsenatibacter silvermanii TaxID=321763 RepID=A0A1G9MIB7_9FIRM|nr:flagellar basal body-associated FliL family protein [Halarsenatibacter silvermanii]SDL74008.1 flagellar FliL protein [Halarsenatibacter silvermanii]
MAEQSKIKRAGMILGIIFLVVFIAGATSFGVLWYLSQQDAEEAEEVELGPTYDLGEYTVNLTGESAFQILQTKIVVEVSSEEVIEEFEERSPQVQDTLISVLRNAGDQELREPGMPGIKEDIKSALNEISRNGEVRNVWFTDFVVQ